MRRALLTAGLIALCLVSAASTARPESLGLIGGGVGRIWVGIDSFNNTGEIKSIVASKLGIPEDNIWTAGQAGAQMVRLASDAAETKCTAGASYPAEWCRTGEASVERIDGACRSFSDDLHSSLPRDNTMCTASADPLICCSGNGTGDCTATCWEDLNIGGADVAIIQASVNDVRGTPTAFCAGSFFDELKVGWQNVIDHANTRGVRVVIAPSVQALGDGQFGTGHGAAQECIRDWLRDSLIPSNPDHIFIDTYQLFQQYEIDHGEAALLGLYADCASKGSSSGDCTHPGTSPNSVGDIGVDLIGAELAEGVLVLWKRRLAED